LSFRIGLGDDKGEEARSRGTRDHRSAGGQPNWVVRMAGRVGADAEESGMTRLIWPVYPISRLRPMATQALIAMRIATS